MVCSDMAVFLQNEHALEKMSEIYIRTIILDMSCRDGHFGHTTIETWNIVFLKRI